MKTSFRRVLNRCNYLGDKGFSLIEVMIAIVVLGVGLLALMALFGRALATVQFSEEDQIAKQKARETLEAIYTARNDTSITFDQILNISSGGIFKDGFNPLYLAGPNGIPGTSSDTSILDRVILPGKDGIMQTAPGAATPAGDDVLVPLSNFKREVLIGSVVGDDGSVNPYMRKATVTIRITSPGRGVREYVTEGYISSYQ
jgi:prepilin-type N-terminal cleavage/methylation domain-containing protein